MRSRSECQINSAYITYIGRAVTVHVSTCTHLNERRNSTY